MKRIIGIIVVAVLIITGIVVQLTNNHEKINVVNKDSGITNKVNVSVEKVAKQNTCNELNFTGILNPVTELNISAQAQGQITSLPVKLGEYKKKGAIIATIDNELKKLALENAKLTETRLQRSFDRIQNIYNGGSATEQQLDDARNAFEIAKIQREQAEKQLSDATIVAPFSGIITQKFVEEGTYINPGSPIVEIIDIANLKVKVNVSETDVYQINKDSKAIVTSDIYQGMELPGQVTFVSDKGDESHNYEMEVQIENSKEHPLKAGSFVNLNITTNDSEEIIVIPREALVGNIYDASVYVVDNNTAKLREIKVKNGSGVGLQVTSGLSEGEKIVVTGQINLVDGTEINIVETSTTR